ncbi:MAG: MerR family transcriptional regulator [Rhodospirillaceae bacterium]|nr:MerR family transcriptional regulator [Rhodospirillaceae bacterium]
MALNTEGTASRRNGKSAAAFRTISEVADDLDVPPHVLRFWETKFAQVRPLKRGGGRRYYRPEDVALLKSIRELLYQDGYTIKGVQRLLKDGAVKPADGEGNGAGNGSDTTAATAKSAEPSSAQPVPARATAAVPVSITAPGAGSIDNETRRQLREVLDELVDLRDRLNGVIG